MHRFPVRIERPVTLVGGGPLDAATLARAQALAPALVAADRAGDRLADFGIVPGWLIGDMDSVRDPASWHACRETEVLHLPEQETTDFEKCLYATEAPWYLAVGFSGGRIDHTLAVLHAMLARPDKTVILLGQEDAMALVPPGRVLRLPVGKGARVSLFPLAETTGTHSEGLVWPVTGLTMAAGWLIGTSNRASGTEIAVGFDRPGALLMVEPDALPGLICAVTGGS